MTQLSASELLRVDKKWTRDVFLSKYKSTDPRNKFQLKNKTKVKLVSDKASIESLELALKGRGNAKALNEFFFFDTDNNVYKGTGAFLKTAEFGSSGGRAGTKGTKVNESAQCVYNAALILKPAGSEYKFKEEYLENAFKSPHSNVDERAFSRIKDLSEDWKHSSEIGALELKRMFPVYFGIGYQHHRGSSTLVKEISKQFKKINGELQPKLFGQEDKWSPADIWMVKTTYIRSFVTELKKTENFIQLNHLLEQSIEKNLLLGVSLKLMKRNATVRWKNYRKGGWKPTTYKFQSYDLGKTGFMKSMYGNIMYTGGRIAFRTIVGTGGFSGEIAGERAQLGKVSGQMGPKSVIGIYAKEYFGQSTTSGAEVLKRYNSDYNELVKEFYINYKNASKGNNNSDFMDSKSFIAAVTVKSNQHLAWFVSKFMATEIMAILNTANDDHNNTKKNGFITDILSYASSQSENSAPFIEIS